MCVCVLYIKRNLQAEKAVIMAARLVFFVVSIALLLVNAYGHATEGGKPIKFGYSGTTGPDKWGSLSPATSQCAMGKSQSPIDIVTKQAVLNKDLKPLVREYHNANATLLNNHFNIEVLFHDNGGELIIDDKKYKLKQMHWHSPSEHHIDGIGYDAELHLVHVADDGTFAVVGVLYKLGAADPLLTTIQGKLGELVVEDSAIDNAVEIQVGMFDPNVIKHDTPTHKYYRYHGSLTTPPCSEIVLWNVLAKERSISKEQLEALKAPLNRECKSNARPVQQLNGRSVELFQP